MCMFVSLKCSEWILKDFLSPWPLLNRREKSLIEYVGLFFFFLLSQHLPLLEVGQNVEICSAFL